MAGAAGKIVMKLLTIAIGIPVGIVIKKLVNRIFAAARPDAQGRRPSEPDVRWGDAIGWAAISAGGIVAAELLTRRAAEEVWRTAIGTEPPPPKAGKGAKKAAKAEKKAIKASAEPTTPLA